MLSGPNHNFDPGGKPNVHTRTKAYHTYAFAPNYGITYRFPADDTASYPSGDLRENDFPAVARKVERILFVFRRGPAAHGRIELPGTVLYGGNASGGRGPVHVHVEN